MPGGPGKPGQAEGCVGETGRKCHHAIAGDLQPLVKLLHALLQLANLPQVALRCAGEDLRGDSTLGVGDVALVDRGMSPRHLVARSTMVSRKPWQVSIFSYQAADRFLLGIWEILAFRCHAEGDTTHPYHHRPPRTLHLPHERIHALRHYSLKASRGREEEGIRTCGQVCFLLMLVKRNLPR